MFYGVLSVAGDFHNPVRGWFESTLVNVNGLTVLPLRLLSCRLVLILIGLI